MFDTGCMAERLKMKLIEKEKAVDVVCGPDAYRDLPRLLTLANTGQTAGMLLFHSLLLLIVIIHCSKECVMDYSIALMASLPVNVMLSLDETYADVMPVRINSNSTSAFMSVGCLIYLIFHVYFPLCIHHSMCIIFCCFLYLMYSSIMRGCDNMCSYCIVPFTRGRERSRPIESIVEEVKMLSQQGIKEVTLLGQNVNSYRDTSTRTAHGGFDVCKEPTKMSRGFNTVYKTKVGGRRFSDLLETVSAVDPEMRIRFTSPHPKDFPDEVLYLIRDTKNICNQLHMPAQSGSSAVLKAMRRGYTREAYLELVDHIRSIIPGTRLMMDYLNNVRSLL